MRDVRIYEGTNGIQALDLVGRKVVGSGGAFCKALLRRDQGLHRQRLRRPGRVRPAAERRRRLDDLTAWLLERVQPQRIGAASVEYLHAFGYTAYAYMWALMAKAALGKGQDEFYASKLGTARSTSPACCRASTP